MKLLQHPLFGIVAAFSIGGVHGQDAGLDRCSCAPSIYEFTFDFGLECPPVNITLGDAVQATSCMTSPFGPTPNVTDLAPAEVESIDVLELGENLTVVVQASIAGPFVDGDSFQYTSVTSTSTTTVPRAIQINTVGVNQFDEPIINVFIIRFTNDCGAYPVLKAGESAGWTFFSRLVPPPPELCPAVPTVAPSGAPIVAPTVAPSGAPVVAPSGAPIVAPTVAPSGAPVVPPVVSPTVPPTAPPQGPSVAPVGSVISEAPSSFSMSMEIEFDLFLPVEFGRKGGKGFAKERKMTKRNKLADSKKETTAAKLVKKESKKAAKAGKRV